MGKKSSAKKTKPNVRPAPTGLTRLPLWMIAAPALAAILAYARILPYEFVYDDKIQVVRNPWIHDFTHVWRFFSTDVWGFTGIAGGSNYYRPLQMLVYAIAYLFGGAGPEAFHAASILLHAACSVWAALIGFRLTQNRMVALAGALLFALHPIHAESVTWIAGITDPLCAAFFLGALYFYLQDGQEPGRPRHIALTLGFYLAALLSKEMAFTFPAVAILADWCLHRKLRWTRYGMLAGVFAFYAILRTNALRAFFVHPNPLLIDPVARVLSTIALLGRYVSKMFVPHDINAYHVFAPATTVLDRDFLFGIAALAIFAMAVWALRRRREILFLSGFCILTIVPALNLNGIGQNVFADRYLYIPTLGSCLIISLVVLDLAGTWFAWLNHRAAAAVLAVVALVFASMLWREVSVWRDDPSLYLETLRRSPRAAMMAHNLACYYYDRNDLEGASRWDTTALQSWDRSFIKNPHDRAMILAGLGNARYRQGRIEEARSWYGEAIKQSPDYYPVLQNVAVFYAGTKDYEKALSLYESAIRSNPGSQDACANAAGLCIMLGQMDKGIAYARKALELDPNDGGACLNLAAAYANKGMKQEARQTYLLLKKIDPSRSAIADEALRILNAAQ